MNSASNISRRHFLSSVGAAGGAAFAASVGSPVLAAAEDKIPIIDCHLHINHFDRSIADTIHHIEVTGTDKAFVLPLETGEGGVLLTSDTVLEAFEKHSDRIIPFCQCDIRGQDVLRRIRHYHELGCRGVGEQKEHLPLEDRRVELLIALCDELNWPITMHFQDGKGGYNQGLAQHLEKYLKRYKRVRIIGHAQTWWAHISADVPAPKESLYPTGPVKPGGVMDRLLGEYPNLYADLSAGSGFNALSRDEDFTAGFLERHRKKLLFGSDCACRDGKGANFRGLCYSTRLQAFLRRMVSDESALEDILRNNALRVLEG